MSRRVWRLEIVMGAVLFGLAGVAAGPPPQQPQPDPQEVLDRAEEALDRADVVMQMAENTSQQTGAMMDFIQTAITISGLVVALAGGALATASIRTLTDYRRQLSDSAARFDELAARLEQTAREADAVRQSLQASLSDEMKAIREQADSAIRALSLLELGENQRRMGNFDEARETFIEAHRLDPDSHSINYFLGELYLVARELDPAVEHLERALAVDPDFAPAIAAKGYAIRLQGERTDDLERRDMLYAQAESHLLAALKMRPRMRNTEGEAVYGTLGGLYRRQRRLHEAIAAYEKAEEVTPQHSYPVINLAVLHAMLGHRDEAADYFERTRALAEARLDDNPFDHWARIDLAFAQLNQGASEAALANYAQAIEQTPARGPLESARNTLGDLRGAPTPPAGLEEAVALLEQALAGKVSGNSD